MRPCNSTNPQRPVRGIKALAGEYGKDHWHPEPMELIAELIVSK